MTTDWPASSNDHAICRSLAVGFVEKQSPCFGDKEKHRQGIDGQPPSNTDSVGSAGSRNAKQLHHATRFCTSCGQRTVQGSSQLVVQSVRSLHIDMAG